MGGLKVLGVMVLVLTVIGYIAVSIGPYILGFMIIAAIAEVLVRGTGRGQDIRAVSAEKDETHSPERPRPVVIDNR